MRRPGDARKRHAGPRLQENVVNRDLERADVESETDGQARLRVEVNEQDRLAALAERVRAIIPDRDCPAPVESCRQLCAVGWLYWTGDTTWGTVLLVWTLLVAPVDNILRPILIKKGADLPLLLIIAGVLGGLLAFGLIGIFVGPVLLAVAYTLFTAWINQDGAISRTEMTAEKTVGKESS